MASYYNDYAKGAEDCKHGIYDKWYRYNHSHDGYAYNLGWCVQNSIFQNATIHFIDYIL